MRNAEVKQMGADYDALVDLLKKARMSEKKDQHFSFSVRLDALAIHAQKNELSAAEIIELLRAEAGRFESSAQEII